MECAFFLFSVLFSFLKFELICMRVKTARSINVFHLIMRVRFRQRYSASRRTAAPSRVDKRFLLIFNLSVIVFARSNQRGCHLVCTLKCVTAS